MTITLLMTKPDFLLEPPRLNVSLRYLHSHLTRYREMTKCAHIDAMANHKFLSRKSMDINLFAGGPIFFPESVGQVRLRRHGKLGAGCTCLQVLASVSASDESYVPSVSARCKQVSQLIKLHVNLSIFRNPPKFNKHDAKRTKINILLRNLVFT